MRIALLVILPALAQQTPTVQERDKASIEGFVLNAATGEPLRKARLTIRMNVAQGARDQRPGLPTPTMTVTTDNSGVFHFPNVEPGDYRLLARRDGFANVELGTREAGKRTEPILVGPGDRKMGLTIKLTPYGAIAGRITDEDGDPVKGVQVAALVHRYTVRGRELAEHRTASTNDLGEYRIFDLPAGRYFLRAGVQHMRAPSAEEAEAFVTSYYPGAQEPTGAAALDLTPGQQLTNIVMTLRRGRFPTIRGRVIAPAGATVSAGIMHATDTGTSTTTSSVEDKDGKFEIHGVAPGRLHVVGSYSLEGHRYTALLPVQVGDADINGVELRPVPPMDVTGVVRIEGETATRVSELGVHLQGPGRIYGMGSGAIAADGTLIIRAVEPNVYRVLPGRMADLYLKSVRWGTTDITDGEIDLTSGVPSRTELTVVFGADAGVIEGAVKNDNEVAGFAVVTLIPAGVRRTRSYYKTATADASGRFSMKGVAPGSYRILAWDKVDANAVMYDPEFLRPYEGASVSLEVRPHEKKNVELKLTLNQTP
jgi:hypothetical protein